MEELLKQIKAIIDKNVPLISNLSNVSALINKIGNLNWCGFYIVSGENLILGPFQGDVACTVIPFGKGVCGTCFKEKKTIIVPNVNEFHGHIACSSLSKSEIVVPVLKNDTVVAVIDLDAPIFDRFHEQEKVFLESVSHELENLFNE